MMWPGGGFIPIIIYGGFGVNDTNALLTENNLNILTESSQNIDVE